MRSAFFARAGAALRAPAAFACVLALTPFPDAGAATVSGELASNTIWEETIDVTGEVVVLDGATLLIQPGTVVRFAPVRNEAGQALSRLIVHGTLVAQGTAAKPILFTSAAGSPKPSDWGGISLERAAARPNRIAHAIIRYAESGISGTTAALFAEDVEIRDCARGITALRELRGGLARGLITGNEFGVYYRQNSDFSVTDSLISGNSSGGVVCATGSSPAIRLSTIVANGEAGVSSFLGSSPLIEGNTISGHKNGIFMELQARPRIFRNIIRENDTGIWGEKLVSPTIQGNTITENGIGIYCNYSAYPVIHGNNISANRTFGLVLGDNMSILMEKKIPFRQMGQFYFTKPPEQDPLPLQTRRAVPSNAIGEGVVDARGNWWGNATGQMAQLTEGGNSAVIEDFHDKPDTWYEEEKFQRDRVIFTPVEPEALKEAAPPAKSFAGIRGKVVSGGKSVAGIRVHAYPNSISGFRGEGVTYSAPTAVDGSFSLDLGAGSWYLVAKGPVPPFPSADFGAGALFGFYGGNPVTLGPGGEATVNIQAIQRRQTTSATEPTIEKSLLEGTVIGPDGPVAGATVHVYTDGSRQFRGPDLFGPQGAVPGGADEKGAFSIELPPGTYFLVASRRKAGDVLGPLQAGDLHGWYDGNPVVTTAGTRTSIIIQAVAKLRDLGATAPGAAAAQAAPGITGIRGTLRDSAGKVPTGAYAFATKDPSFMIGAMPPHRSQPIGADGAFFIEIPASGGTFYVSARTGYGGPPLPGEWHGFHGDAKPAPVVVEANRVTEGINVVLKRME